MNKEHASKRGTKHRSNFVVRFARFVLRAVLALTALGIALFLLIRVPEYLYDLWSWRMIDPVVKKADALAQRSDIAGAENLIQAQLALHPDNPALLYEMAALHFDDGDTARGVFYAIVYLRSSRDESPKRVNKLLTLFRADPDILTYLSKDNLLHYGNSLNDRDVTWLFRNRAPARAVAALEAQTAEDDPTTDHSLVKELKADERFYDQLPNEWMKHENVLAENILAPRSLDEVHNHPAGLVQLTTEALRKKGRVYARSPWQWLFFARGRLWDAVRTGIIDAPAPEYGPHCCQLALTDPALRPLSDVMSGLFARWGGKNPAVDSARGATEFLDVREHALYKQLFMIEFAIYSWAPVSIDDKQVPVVTHFPDGNWNVTNRNW